MIGGGPAGSFFSLFLLDLAKKVGLDVSVDIYDKKDFSRCGAVGVNTSTSKLFKGLNFGYQPPRTTKTFICEFLLGREMIQKYFGNSMHIFLLNIPRLEFAALIPKGDNVTMVLLGKDIDKKLVESLLNTPEVKRCFPPEYDLKKSYPCSCFPEINIKSALKPFSDRVVLIGDCFGEMALFDHNVRSATVCSIGESRILTVDKNKFLHWTQKDHSMAFQIMQTANDRVRKLTDQVSRMKASDRRDWESRPDKK